MARLLSQQDPREKCAHGVKKTGLMGEMNPTLHPIDSSLEKVSLYVSLSEDCRMAITKEIQHAAEGAEGTFKPLLLQMAICPPSLLLAPNLLNSLSKIMTFY